MTISDIIRSIHISPGNLLYCHESGICATNIKVRIHAPSTVVCRSMPVCPYCRAPVKSRPAGGIQHASIYRLEYKCESHITIDGQNQTTTIISVAGIPADVWHILDANTLHNMCMDDVI